MTVQISGTGGISKNSIPFLAGQVVFMAGTSTPAGFLNCDGALVSRTIYASLFSVIGTVYGAGDGATTFALPDLRGEFIRALDEGRGVDVGRAIGTAQADGLKSHTHNFQYTSQGAAAGGTNVMRQVAGSIYDGVQATGGTETRPRNVALLCCIFAGV